MRRVRYLATVDTWTGCHGYIMRLKREQKTRQFFFLLLLFLGHPFVAYLETADITPIKVHNSFKTHVCANTWPHTRTRAKEYEKKKIPYDKSESRETDLKKKVTLEPLYFPF